MPEIIPERLPFEKAIKWFKQRISLPSSAWDEIINESVDFGFAIAGVTEAELLNDFYQSILKALEDGTTLQQFQKDFDSIVAKRGWKDGGNFSAWRRELIFSQNLRSAYAAGRYQQTSLALGSP
jgi:hypothetical protein